MSSDEDKKKGKGRVVITNVRVTKETHVRMKTLADLWGVSLSDAVNRLIDKQAPEVDDIIRQRAEQKRRFTKDDTDDSSN